MRVINVRGLRTPEQRHGVVVYCGRVFAGWPGHPLANPFHLGHPADDYLARSACVERYTTWLLARPTLEADLAALWEQTEHGALPLGCWCCNSTTGDGSPLVCHAQILGDMLADRFENPPRLGLQSLPESV